MVTYKVVSEFCQDWEVFVGEQAFWKRLCQMEKDIALKEGKRRGWFSYTDLENLLDTIDLVALAHTVLTVSECSFIVREVLFCLQECKD